MPYGAQLVIVVLIKEKIGNVKKAYPTFCFKKSSIVLVDCVMITMVQFQRTSVRASAKYAEIKLKKLLTAKFQ
jgi:hypothetical protein